MSKTTIKITIDHPQPPFEIWYTMSKAAKLIGKMGRNKLYEFLRGEGVLMHHNEPYQTYCDQGHFKLEEVPKYNSRGQLHQYFPVLFVSPKGIDFIKKLIQKKEEESVDDE